MAQDFVEALYRWLLSSVDVLRSLLPSLIALALGCGALIVLYLRVDPNGSAALRARLKAIWTPTSRSLVVLGAVLLFCGFLSQGRHMVGTRRQTLRSASASRKNEPVLSAVVQYAPSIAVMKEKTYTRRITLPADIASRIGRDGLEVLTPYLTNPGADDVLKLGDSFVHSGSDIVFTRELTRRDEVPVAAESAEVKVDFRAQGSSSAQHHYQAKVAGVYVFKNPGAAATEMRFLFPLPQGGGTVTDFGLEVDGRKINEPDIQGQFAWSDTVPPGGIVRATVAYTVSGGSGFSYVLGSDRRRTGDFHLVVTGQDLPRFEKTAIYPTTLTSTGAEWSLHNVLTNQTIALVFAPGNVDEELFDKTLAVLPLLLVAFAVLAIWQLPASAPQGVVCFGLGLLGMSVGSAYLPFVGAVFAGAVAAFLLGGFGLRSRRGWLISGACSLGALVFLSREHGTLLLLALGLAITLVALVTRWLSQPEVIDFA